MDAAPQVLAGLEWLRKPHELGLLLDAAEGGRLVLRLRDVRVWTWFTRAADRGG
ncbi:MAG: hypothetical protein KF873_18660 [Gemmataceae bacterium]|nr:hypothetical protein [Gemmataceae bacterium]